MGKTRALFKNISDTKGTFHAKMGLIKDRHGMDLTEAEDIKKRWQEYTEEVYKKDLHDQDNHDGVITHQNQTSWNVKSSGPWKASLRTKLVEVIEFQLSYFKSKKDDAVKVLHSICQQIWKTHQWPQHWKRSVFFPIPKKRNAKNAQTTTQLHSSHMLAK